MKKIILTICLATGLLYLSAQTVFTFSEGLASGRAHRYGRDAMYGDTLAYQMYTKALAVPKAGETWFGQGAEAKKWSAVKADSTGMFRGREMSNGYLYLTYQSAKAQPAILTVSGHSMVYFNGEAHAGDQYRYGWMHVPVMLRKGLNEVYVRSGMSGRFGGIKATLEIPAKPVKLSKGDATLPFVVKGISKEFLWAGIVCLNASDKEKNKLTVEARTGNQSIQTELPAVMAFGTRKMPVKLPVPASPSTPNTVYNLTLMEAGKVLDTMSITLTTVEAHQHQSHTFISDIDGSVQYYAVAPQAGGPGANPSLYFSVHGAEVEAISQARAYKPKAEGPVVAPTNRRPRGFNWEDWGRLDALEVLAIAKKNYQPHPQKIYLTGHSMGGHGTWYLGATYAGQWAAIAPCAGYPTLATYGSADGLVPRETSSPVRSQIIRASNPSNVMGLVKNYKAGGVYIFHGDSDRTVSVNYARQMRKELGDFHQDFTYYEYPGGSHWFGDISVDWPPLFNYFNQHSIPLSSNVHHVDFTTPSPAISAKHHWVEILQQEKSYEYSKVQLHRDTGMHAIKGTTENITSMALTMDGFKPGTKVGMDLDGQRWEITTNGTDHTVVLNKINGRWAEGQRPALSNKGISRNGGFKEPFNQRMVFVYGTKGNAEENAWAKQKARYDAETWYYRGNGAVDVIADVQFTEAAYANRGVVIYGNATTNSAYALLLAGCPVQIANGTASIGATKYQADDIGAYFMWPRQGSTVSSVAVIGGTGVKGMRAADANQYFAGGSGFPDFMFFSLSMLTEGEKGLKAAGYYDNDWKVSSDWVEQK